MCGVPVTHGGQHPKERDKLSDKMQSVRYSEASAGSLGLGAEQGAGAGAGVRKKSEEGTDNR